jgi:hypothetical protein
MYYRIREDFSHILSLERTGNAAAKAKKNGDKSVEKRG